MKKPIHLVRITLYAAYDRPLASEYYAGLEAITEGFAEQLRDDANVLTVASDLDEAEQPLDPEEPDDSDELIVALLKQWPEPKPEPPPQTSVESQVYIDEGTAGLERLRAEPAKVFALYTSVARYGCNGIDLYPSARAAYAALADTLQQIEDDPDAEAIPEDLDELIEWCEARADDDGCEWFVSEVDLPKESAR